MTMSIVYGVQWIDVDFGQRNHGYHVYTNKEECISHTRDASLKGSYGDGYYGPERPLTYYEIPVDCLALDVKETLFPAQQRLFGPMKGYTAITDKNWQPQFKSKPFYI